ncbi:hypothetical protein CWATWH8502_1920 [Crocosphaera watsonii WH 8502]|uniref:Uncharacterized protein n=1 Tax=Crocosphaera watsonii WH 8502 TaxID=423474 RepID=T2IDX1_CROWT|nr:hypothetical protein CWATWH8502_1920 [Crocosphaera watsonii WH 8502]
MAKMLQTIMIMATLGLHWTVVPVTAKKRVEYIKGKFS